MLNEPMDTLPLQPDAPQEEPAAAASTEGNITAFPIASEPDQGERLPGLALAYVFAIFLAGLISVAVFAPQLDTTDMGGFVVLAILAIAFGRTRVPIYGDTSVSIGMVGDFAIAFLYGPAGAVIVSPFAAIATDLGVGAWYKRLFNVGLIVLSNVVVAFMVRSLVHIVGPGLPVNAWLIPIALMPVDQPVAMSFEEPVAHPAHRFQTARWIRRQASVLRLDSGESGHGAGSWTRGWETPRTSAASREEYRAGRS